MLIIGGYAFGYIERYEAFVKHKAKKKVKKNIVFSIGVMPLLPMSIHRDATVRTNLIACCHPPE